MQNPAYVTHFSKKVTREKTRYMLNKFFYLKTPVTTYAV